MRFVNTLAKLKGKEEVNRGNWIDLYTRIGIGLIIIVGLAFFLMIILRGVFSIDGLRDESAYLVLSLKVSIVAFPIPILVHKFLSKELTFGNVFIGGMGIFALVFLFFIR